MEKNGQGENKLISRKGRRTKNKEQRTKKKEERKKERKKERTC